MEINKRTACIDGDSIIYICSANKIIYDKDSNPVIDDLGNKVKENKSEQDCKNLVDGFIDYILSVTGATHYILALTIGKNFRYQLYPSYKSNRKYLDRPVNFDRIKEYLITKYRAVYDNNLESDDIVRICSKRFTKDDDYAYICSPDKDLILLEGHCFNYKKNIWIETSKDQSEYAFWSSLITGDTSDGVPGLKNKGISFVSKLFKDKLVSEYPKLVFDAYIEDLGYKKGIEEFYINYRILTIVDEDDQFLIPELQEYIRKEKINDIDVVENNKTFDF